MHKPPSHNDDSQPPEKMKPGGDGLLVIDKPGGMTSRDVVNRVQAWFPRRTSIGHAGTLDPLATGVLVLCVGRATRLIEYVQRMDKEYRGGIVFGARSDTDDADGNITPVVATSIPDRDRILQELAGFIGVIEQVPPAYSAAKIGGRRAHQLARQGKDVTLKPRSVRIDSIDVLACDYPNLDVLVRCGKGTYIRSLARDLGERLGCAAYLANLRRTRIGPFRAEDALALDSPAEIVQKCMRNMAAALTGLTSITLPVAELARLRQGQAVTLAECPTAEVAVYDSDGALAALGEWRDGRLHPVKVL